MKFLQLWGFLVACSFWFSSHSLAQSTQTSPADSSQNALVRGQVSELMDGKQVPLVGAIIIWEGTSSGTATDANGHFQLAAHSSSRQLIISYVGYQSDTLTIKNPSIEVLVTLRSTRTLQEVTVSGSPGQVDRLNPIQTEYINQRTLAKAACCNLSESFETNASVSVSYSDAVTGSKQIQFLGLGGQYVQTNVENIPTIRGLSTAFGLNFIPGTWITGIDIGKGAGSVVNGYESMSGQMNIELQKPDDKQKLFLNGYVNSFGRIEGNINWSKTLARKNRGTNNLWPGQKERPVADPRWSMGLLGHVSTLRTELDQNNDGFRDLPLYTQLNIVNRYRYSSDRFMAQFGVKALYEDRDGGQLSSAGASRYSFLNTTKRLEVFSKTAKLYPDKPYKGLGLILNGVHHEQSARFGFAPYDGRQQTVYANLIYQSIIGTTNNSFKAGLSYLLDDYRELYRAINTARTESVPGAFVEYTYTYPEKLTLILGGRVDFHNLFGTQFTPRAHLKYSPSQNITLRASAGRGFRAANPFTENFGYLVSSRAVFLNNPLQFESSWNYGLSLTNDFTVLGKKASLVLDFHRTDFQNQLIVDIEHPGELYFYNLAESGRKGRSYATSFQAELNVQPAKRFDVKAAYRLFDVEQSMGGPFGEERLLPKMMISRDRIVLNAGYALPYDKWKFDATLQWNGPRRIPYLREGYVHTSYQNMPIDMAPGFYNLNAQVSRGFRSGLEIYLGGENLTGFRQLNPIIAANDPFGARFDAGATVWGPITGRMVYMGFRFNLNPDRFMTLTIRNMVCDRCKRIVREELETLGLIVHRVDLGAVEINSLPPTLTLDDVRRTLQGNGFDLVDDRKQLLVEQIKILLINEIQYLKGERLLTENYSTFLERKIGYEYSYLSGLFSASEGQTLEKYSIALKIEKVKEWLRYDELTLSEIAWRLGYSSVQHLSNQFRQVTGQTPGQFRKATNVDRRNLDEL